MKKFTNKKILVATAVLLSTLSVQAHQLWLERDAQTVKEYFGHFPNFKENEEGKRLGAIKGLVMNPKEAYVSTKRAHDHIEVKTNTQNDVAMIEEMSPRKGKDVDYIVRTIFMAKEGRTNTNALLPLDLVPTKANSNEFTLLMDGKPLTRTVVNVTARNGWSKKLRTDVKGVVSIDTPWAGDYVASATHVDKKEGEKDGKAYKETKYVMTLHFKVD